jgi:hypothetical protein
MRKKKILLLFALATFLFGAGFVTYRSLTRDQFDSRKQRSLMLTTSLVENLKTTPEIHMQLQAREACIAHASSDEQIRECNLKFRTYSQPKFEMIAHARRASTGKKR